MNKRIKFIMIVVFSFFMVFTLWTAIDRANPLYLYAFSYPFQNFRAKIEAKNLKPFLEKFSINKGDCRIKNTIAAIKNPDLYIVFGKFYDPKTKAGGDHQWTTINPGSPSLYEYITDNTTGLTEEKKKRAYYMPKIVYKLDVEKCKLTPVKQFKELTDEEEFLVKSGEFFVEAFCKNYKEIWL